MEINDGMSLLLRLLRIQLFSNKWYSWKVGTHVGLSVSTSNCVFSERSTNKSSERLAKFEKDIKPLNWFCDIEMDASIVKLLKMDGGMAPLNLL